MQFIKKIKLIWPITGHFITISLIFFLTGRDFDYLLYLLFFSLCIILNQILLFNGLEVILPKNKNFNFNKKKFYRRNLKLKKGNKYIRAKNIRFNISKKYNIQIRNNKKWEECHYIWNSSLEISYFKFILIMLGKTIILVTGLLFCIKFGGLKIFSAVVHYVIQIFIFILSIKRDK